MYKKSKHLFKYHFFNTKGSRNAMYKIKIQTLNKSKKTN